MSRLNRYAIAALFLFVLAFPLVWNYQTRISSPEKPAYLNDDFYRLRGFVKDIDGTRQKLQEMGGKKVTRYHFTDTLFAEKGASPNFEKGYLRIREYHTPSVSMQPFEVCKQSLTEGGIPIKERFHFKTFQDAKTSLGKRVEPLFSFARTGWQYSFGKTQIFVEDIEHLGASVEIMSPSLKGAKRRFEKLEATEITEASTPFLFYERSPAR